MLKRSKKKKENSDMTALQRWENTWYAVKFIYQVNKKLYYIRGALLILQTISSLIPVLFIRLIVNEIMFGKDLKKVLLYAGAMAALSFVLSVITKALGLWDSKAHEVTSYKVKEKLSKTVMGMPYCATESPDIKDRIWVVKYNKFEDTLLYLTGLIGAVLNVVGLSAVIFSIKPSVFIVILIASVLRMIIDRKQRFFPWQFHEKKSPVDRRMSYYQKLMHDAQFGKEVRANNLENWLYDKYDHCYKQNYLPVFNKYIKKMEGYSGLINVVSFIQEGVIYLILAFEVIFRGMTIGDFSMYFSGSSQLFDSVMGVAGCYYNLMGHSWSTRSYRECIDMAEKMRIENGTVSLGKLQSVKIEFKNVSFKYPNTDRMILENINLIIEPGETLSIVGVNGAGKTTFVKLLCRFYEPTEGEILINGIPAKDIMLEEYYDLLSVVFQDFKLFPFTVHENISMDTQYNGQRLKECIDKAGLSDRIKQLPQGRDTMLFKEFDSEGVELSGGEGQKLAIARALYKDTPIVIFDEPTSALDPIAEYEIYRNFDRLAEKRSAIYISHRLSSTRFTDKIAVFSDGRLAEYGNHAELMNKEEGIYKAMFKMQAQYYS